MFGLTYRTLTTCFFIVAFYILGVLICKEYAEFKLNEAGTKPIHVVYSPRAQEIGANFNTLAQQIAQA
jgi:hypothetical protein